jgi:hypothetical protein
MLVSVGAHHGGICYYVRKVAVYLLILTRVVFEGR